MFCEIKFFFSSQVYLKAIFYTARFFTFTKNLNAARTPTKMKQKLLFWFFSAKIFVTFARLLNIIIDECSIFLFDLKSVFINDDTE